MSVVAVGVVALVASAEPVSGLDPVLSRPADGSCLSSVDVVSHVAILRPAARSVSVRSIKGRSAEVAQLRPALSVPEPQVSSFVANSTLSRVDDSEEHPVSARAPPAL